MKIKRNFMQVIKLAQDGLILTLTLLIKQNQEKHILKTIYIFQLNMIKRCIHKYTFLDLKFNNMNLGCLLLNLIKLTLLKYLLLMFKIDIQNMTTLALLL
jgi:hypothetical protein